MKKLFIVSVMDDCEMEEILVIAETEEEAKSKIKEDAWPCLMFCSAREIDEVDGYRITVEKI